MLHSLLHIQEQEQEQEQEQPMKTLEQRFWSRVKRGGEQDCWTWGGRREQGKYTYGRLKIQKQDRTWTTGYAHRIAWELEHGPVPKQINGSRASIMHTCDNPACVNPAHLILGNQKHNLKDCVEKGRHKNGAKATNEYIRKLEQRIEYLEGIIKERSNVER